MTITIPPELERQVQERARAEGLTVEAYIERLIREDEWAELGGEPLDATDPDFAETRAAVMEGLDQIERGEGRPVREVFRGVTRQAWDIASILVHGQKATSTRFFPK